MRLGEVVPAPVVGDPVVQIDLRSSKRRHQPPGLSWWPAFGLGTLLGPEATGPLFALSGVGVLSLHLGGGVWCLFCG